MIQRVVGAALAALLLISCSKDGQPPESAAVVGAVEEASMSLDFQASSMLNPGPTGQPAPVRVRIYELKNTAGFTRADYFALAERAQATLGADLIDQDEVLLQPGEQLTVRRSLAPATRHVGLVVNYREIDQAQWRTVLDVAPRQTSNYQISLAARAIGSATSAPSRPAP
jgi:type VI secretion system protein VasD